MILGASLTVVLLVETFWAGVGFVPLIGSGVLISHGDPKGDFEATQLFHYAGTVFGILLAFFFVQLGILISYGYALLTKNPAWLLPYVAWRLICSLTVFGLMIPIGLRKLEIALSGGDSVSAAALFYPFMLVAILGSGVSVAAVLRARSFWLKERAADADGWRVEIFRGSAYEIPACDAPGILPTDQIFHAGF